MKLSLSPAIDPPSISDLTYQEENCTLTCVSTGSPATTVSWMKDGQPLTIDGSTYHLTQTITDRSSSTYSNVLTVSETAPSGVAGTYNCTVTNELGSVSSDVVAVGKGSCSNLKLSLILCYFLSNKNFSCYNVFF